MKKIRIVIKMDTTFVRILAAKMALLQMMIFRFQIKTEKGCSLITMILFRKIHILEIELIKDL